MQDDKEKSSMDEVGGQGMAVACLSRSTGRAVCPSRTGRARSSSAQPKAGGDARCPSSGAVRDPGAAGHKEHLGTGRGSRTYCALLLHPRLALPRGRSAQRPRLRRAPSRPQLPGACWEKRFSRMPSLSPGRPPAALSHGDERLPAAHRALPHPPRIPLPAGITPKDGAGRTGGAPPRCRCGHVPAPAGTSQPRRARPRWPRSGFGPPAPGPPGAHPRSPASLPPSVPARSPPSLPALRRSLPGGRRRCPGAELAARAPGRSAGSERRRRPWKSCVPGGGKAGSGGRGKTTTPKCLHEFPSARPASEISPIRAVRGGSRLTFPHRFTVTFGRQAGTVARSAPELADLFGISLLSWRRAGCRWLVRREKLITALRHAGTETREARQAAAPPASAASESMRRKSGAPCLFPGTG